MRKSEVNYYNVLGIKAGASSSEIKQSYRALSKVHHPDANGGDGARMALINEAYATLSDPLKRMDYTPPTPPQPQSKPIRTANTYQTNTASPWPKKATQPKYKPAPEEASWSFLLWYILAVPLAIFVVTVGPSTYKSLQAKADALMADKQTPAADTSAGSANSANTSPETQSTPTNSTSDNSSQSDSNATPSTTSPATTTQPDQTSVDQVPTTTQGLQYYLYGNRHYKKSN